MNFICTKYIKGAAFLSETKCEVYREKMVLLHIAINHAFGPV
jgi:hypothetical protein